jgi:hypothetical protein
MYFEPGKRQRATTYQTIEIYDQNGVDAFTTLTLDLSPTYERLYINTLEVLDENGKVIEKGKPETYYLQDRSKDGVASFRQVACLPVPAVRPGCTIRLVATKETRAAEQTLSFTDEWLGHLYPTASAFCAVSGSVARIKSVEYNGVTKRAKGDTILWTVSNPQRMVIEPMMPPVEQFVPHVALIDAGSTWAVEANDYLTLIAPRLAANDAVKMEVASLNLAGKTPMQKLRAIVDHVDRKFTYKALAFGPRARMPTDPGEILRNRYGDCKDMSLITHLLLREAGVKSHLALVHASGAVTSELPSLDQFDHMIVNVPDCEGNWWIDCTGDDIDPIMTAIPPFYLQGREALLLDGLNSKLVHLPEWDSATSNVEIERTVELKPDGQLSVSDKIDLRGVIAHYYRSALRGAELSRRENRILELCALESNEIRDSKATVDNVDDYLKPLSMRVSYSPRQKLRSAGSRLVGDMPAALEKQFLSPELISDRKTPMYDAYGAHMKVKIALTLPPGMSLEGVESDGRSLDSIFGKGAIRFTRGDRGYTGELSIQSPSFTAPANQYEPFCEWRQSIIDAWAIPLIVNKQ